MINTLTVKNVGCIKDATVALTPLHAVIGPNDSGKSTLLRAARTIMNLASGAARDDISHGIFGGARAGPAGSVEIRAGFPGGEYALVQSDALREGLDLGGGAKQTLRGIGDEPKVFGGASGLKASKQFGRAHLVRLDANALRMSSGLRSESQALEFLESRGEGLPGVYYAILSRGDDSFVRLVKRVRELFPAVKTLRVPPVSTQAIMLEAELTDGTRVPAKDLSEGLLYYLAFAALPYLTGAAMILVEEPENGLHPSRIADVVRIMRSIAEPESGPAMQVLIATHSPLVINELRPEEVTVVTRPRGEGSKFTPMKDTPNFAERSKIYALGELWLSYANGVDEAPLLTTTPAPNPKAEG